MEGNEKCIRCGCVKTFSIIDESNEFANKKDDEDGASFNNNSRVNMLSYYLEEDDDCDDDKMDYKKNPLIKGLNFIKK